MSLKSLKANQLDKSELLAIKAGAAPDCADGTILIHIPGVGYECVPQDICQWVIYPDPDPIGTSDNPPAPPENEGHSF